MRVNPIQLPLQLEMARIRISKNAGITSVLDLQVLETSLFRSLEEHVEMRTTHTHTCFLRRVVLRMALLLDTDPFAVLGQQNIKDLLLRPDKPSKLSLGRILYFIVQIALPNGVWAEPLVRPLKFREAFHIELDRISCHKVKSLCSD